MYNLIILGCGRSGTSMAAGLFSKSGYFMGKNLYEPNPANPKGFFENWEINSINEEIIAPAIQCRPKGIIGNLFFRDRLMRQQLWLARVPLDAKLICTPPLQKRISSIAANEPFCFKDPRFSYTLPSWRPLLKNTRFLVVFRHPADTVKSILKERKDAKYLHKLSMTREDALETWQLMYSHILNMPRTDGSWLFLHYDQILGQQALNQLELFAETTVDRSFPEKSLKRSVSDEAVPARADSLYRQLCSLAQYAPA